MARKSKANKQPQMVCAPVPGGRVCGYDRAAVAAEAARRNAKSSGGLFA